MRIKIMMVISLMCASSMLCAQETEKAMVPIASPGQATVPVGGLAGPSLTQSMALDDYKMIENKMGMFAEALRSRKELESFFEERATIIGSNQKSFVINKEDPNKKLVLDYLPLTTSWVGFEKKSIVLNKAKNIIIEKEKNVSFVQGDGEEFYSKNGHSYKEEIIWDAVLLNGDGGWKIKSLHLSTSVYNNEINKEIIKESEEKYRRLLILISCFFGILTLIAILETAALIKRRKKLKRY